MPPPDPTVADDPPLYWVTSIRSGPVPGQGLVFLGFDCSAITAGCGQESSPNYVLTRSQARELVESLRDSLAVLDAVSRERDESQKK